MPAPRAILADIEKNNLDPKKEYKSTNKKGHLVSGKKEKELAEKPGLVFLKTEKVDDPKPKELAKVEDKLTDLVEENSNNTASLSVESSNDVLVFQQQEQPQAIEQKEDMKEVEEKLFLTKNKKFNKPTKA